MGSLVQMANALHNFELEIGCTNEYLEQMKQALVAVKQEIASATKNVETLAIDTSTLRLRVKELEFDEEIVKKSEDEAVAGRIIARKQLVEIGGHESVIRDLLRTLADAKRELLETKSELCLIALY